MTDQSRSNVAAGAVIAGVVPGQSPRVVREAARYAALSGAPLVIVHVDTTRFVAFEDPDGYVHSSTVDVAGAASKAALEEVRRAATEALADDDVSWSVRQEIGDPALALIHLADELGASLLVVGTRKRGLGESLREFLTGSVAARLTHRQRRPVLVVPLGEPAGADDQLPWE
ncbi:Nucleotide-binding universal stress protein, UspA family [Microbacterium sp. ru370.1]|uniref:universal stress protein n=1 Tax=unclassified Microbacterium TaxID=2609290 RepID=UPI000886E9E6|nr:MULTISPECIES: universal stress protein [unclassified Microbacterium]SDO39360.1 Nucleotide-binding universal stress protein, UspA family [Microbacterium sp. ru370.1]SIT79318.1 Nucleotide-binding universal stress protein, UspA family [Microbacterium sp. RU1D]